MTRRELLRLLSFATSAGAVAVQTGTATAENTTTTTTHGHLHPPPQQQLQMGSEQIAILVYPEFTALDALGPHYALSGMMGATVRFVSKTLDSVPCEGASNGGFCVKPHMTFANCPENLDLLLIPGGLVGTLAAIEDKDTIRFIQKCADKTKLLGSVCTGSLVLGAAGLLKGRKATSHWQMLEALKVAGATPISERIVFDGFDRVTAAGVSAGLDLGFELVRRFRGDFYAKGMQLLAEYDPQPPFPGGGNPKTADPIAVNMLNMMHAPLVDRFRDSMTKSLPKSGS